LSTPYHAKYFAYELTRKGGMGVDRLSQSLFDACVDLNPHQIEAALFALKSPISKGVLLADEVGLGKTIEAGLILCQFWAERKRKLLVICPASIRKQWALELEEKFNLPCKVLDAKSYKEAQANGSLNPFDVNAITIVSMHFASSKASDIRPIQWDLVVIDEAHKLRNAYRESNRMGQNIRWALEEKKKILLTATPLQNSLLELYGLSTIIDDRLFGNLPSFRTQYVGVGSDLDVLRDRLQSFLKFLEILLANLLKLAVSALPALISKIHLQINSPCHFSYQLEGTLDVLLCACSCKLLKFGCFCSCEHVEPYPGFIGGFQQSLLLKPV